MQADFVFVLLVFSILAIIFVLSKLDRAIKSLNSRVNVHSDTLKKMKREIKEAIVSYEEEGANKNP